MSKMSQTIAILGVVAGLGVAALPLSTYAADPATASTTDKPTTVELTVPDTLTITTDADKIVLSGASGAATGVFTADKTLGVTVTTNNNDGYTLVMNATETDLKSGSDTIPTGTGAVEANSTWGFYLGDAAETAPETWTAVSNGVNVLNTGLGTKAVPEGETSKVNFIANIIASQPAGTYSGTVTFTATNKAAVAEP